MVHLRCTTSRESLELGKAVVTLPHKYLGSRWTAAYYDRMADAQLVAAVVAADEADFVAKAVRLGTDPVARTEVEGRILASLHRIMRKQAAVKNWVNMILDIAPAEDHATGEPTHFCLPEDAN